MLVEILRMRLGQFTTIKKKPPKGIYGSPSKQDLKELKEEGIETQVIPWINDRDN